MNQIDDLKMELEVWEAFYRNLQCAAKETSDLLRDFGQYLPPVQQALFSIELTQIAQRLTDKQMSVHPQLAVRVLSSDPKRWEELVSAARLNAAVTK